MSFVAQEELDARVEPKRKAVAQNLGNGSVENDKAKKPKKKRIIVDEDGEEDELHSAHPSDGERTASQQLTKNKEYIDRAGGPPEKICNTDTLKRVATCDSRVVPTSALLTPPATLTRTVPFERPLRDISQLGELRDDAKSMRGTKNTYPYDKKTHLELNPHTPRTLSDCMAGYRNRGVIVAAYFSNTSALKQAVGSLPPPTSNDERVVLMFTDPDVLNHRAAEAMPLLQLEKSVAVSNHLPGVLIASFDPMLVITMSAGHVAADHVFISPYVHREVTVLDKLSFCGELARIPNNSALIMYKLVGEEDILHLQLIITSGDERAAHDVKMPCLEVTEAVEVKLQLPVLSDSYQQYMYIELNPMFLNTFLSAAPRMFGRKAKGSKRLGKGNSVEESEEGGDARDAGRAVMFRVYVKGDTHAKLVVQTAEQKPSTTPTETTIRELRPARGKNFMAKCETGDRLYMQMLGGATKGMPGDFCTPVSQMLSEDEEALAETVHNDTSSSSLDGYRAVACVIMSIDNARMIACSMQKGTVMTSRPTLLLPYAYDGAIFDSNRQMQTNGSMVVYVENNSRDQNNSCYYLARAACALDSTEELMERFDEPQSVTTFAQDYGSAMNLIDQRFSLSTY